MIESIGMVTETEHPLKSGPPPEPFEELEHTADTALRVNGRDFRELLRNAALGMNRIMAPEPRVGPLNVHKTIDLDAIDRESLLVEWLSELLFWAETQSLLFTEFDFHDLSPQRLRATIRGGKAPGLKNLVKAVTYHNLAIQSRGKVLTATIVFDI
jgi:SHS2 domain-containing protein